MRRQQLSMEFWSIGLPVVCRRFVPVTREFGNLRGFAPSREKSPRRRVNPEREVTRSREDAKKRTKRFKGQCDENENAATEHRVSVQRATDGELASRAKIASIEKPSRLRVTLPSRLQGSREAAKKRQRRLTPSDDEENEEAHAKLRRM